MLCWHLANTAHWMVAKVAIAVLLCILNGSHAVHAVACYEQAIDITGDARDALIQSLKEWQEAVTIHCKGGRMELG